MDAAAHLRIVILSDTHLKHDFDVPDGDVLVHCGDFTMEGDGRQIARFDAWIAALPHRWKIVVAGNHEFGFEAAPEVAQRLLQTPIYLQDSAIVVEGVKFYGSPWQPWFHEHAFNFPPGERGRERAEETWAKIPDDTDVLITHGPPRGILDKVGSRHCGCEYLLEAVERVKPKLHAFGHIHIAYGTLRRGETLFVNAAIVDGRYQPVNRPVVVDVSSQGAVLV
jgi:Icc-related predicted phosphoesterase